MRWRTVRGLGLATLAVSGVLVTTSCISNKYDGPGGARTTAAAPSAPATTKASGSVPPTVPPTVLPTSFAPAASAGGVCAAITYAEIQGVLGLVFQISAADGKAGDVRTCVLLPVDGALPDLTFVATPLDADVTVDDYTTDLVPKGATDQDGLGRAGYSRVVAATPDAGPTTEIGWLGEETAYTLSLTLEKATGLPGAATYVPKLVTLAPKLIG